MARGFGTTDGVATTDRISYAAYSDINNLDIFTYAIWVYRSSGGSSFGRMMEKDGRNLLLDSGIATYEFAATRWPTIGEWTVPEPSADEWHRFLITYDYSSTANDPLMYLDGISQTVTETAVPSGTKLSDVGDLVIGNRPSANRVWGGRLAEPNIWNVILNPDEILADARRVPPLRIRPDNLVFYPPVWGIQSPEPNFRGNRAAGTVTGTARVNHPPITPFTPKWAATMPFIGAGGATYNEAITLAGGAAQAQLAGLILEESLSLDASGGMTEGAVASLAAALGLSASGAMTPTAEAAFSALISLGASADYDTTGILGNQVYNVFATLDASAGITTGGTLVMQVAHALSAGAGISLAAQNEITSALGLSSAATLTPINLATLGAELAFGAQADIAAVAQQVSNAVLALGASAAQAQQAGKVITDTLTLAVAAVLAQAENIGGALGEVIVATLQALVANRTVDAFVLGSHWQMWQGTLTATIATDSAKAHAGERYLAMEGSTAFNSFQVERGSNSTVKLFPVVPGDTIHGEAWAYVDSAGGGTGGVQFIIMTYDAGKVFVGYAMTPALGHPSADVWTLLTAADYVIPAGIAFISCRMKVYVTSGQMKARFDDAEMTINAGPNLLGNPGFERLEWEEQLTVEATLPERTVEGA